MRPIRDKKELQHNGETTASEQRKRKEGEDTSRRENWGKSEWPQLKAFFPEPQENSMALMWKKKKKVGSVGAWADEVIKLLGCISIHGWEEVLLGVMLARCWSSCVQLLNEALRDCHHVHSHISAGRIGKGGKSTDPLVVLYFSHCAIIVYLPHLFIN